jgi:glycosyltransferase involved in cell wall biosynthesis
LFFVRLLRLLRRVRPDLVHVHSRRGADIWGGLAARACAVPAVLTRRVDNPDRGWPARWKYGLYSRVITISRGIRDVLLSQGLPEEKIVCVPSAVDAGLCLQECDQAWFRSEFGLAEQDVPIGMIAQFIERKGHRYLLRALPEIVRACPEVKVLLFGQGPLRESVRRELREAGLDGRAVMAGFRNDLHRILPCLRVVIHPALMEGLGVSLLQAAASGVPLVAFSAGGVPEIVRHGHNGYLVAPGDAQGLAAAVASLLTDGGLACAMGEAGRSLVRDRFSLQAMVEGNKAIYRQLA